MMGPTGSLWASPGVLSATGTFVPGAGLGGWSGRSERSRQPFTCSDLEVQPVFRRRERAGPARVECTGRLGREVEVQDQGPRVGLRAWIRAEIGALGAIHEVAARSVRRCAVGGVAEGDEQTAAIARDPEDRQGSLAVRERQSDRADPCEGRTSEPLLGRASDGAPMAGGAAGSTRAWKRSAGSWSKWRAWNPDRSVSGTGDCGCSR